MAVAAGTDVRPATRLDAVSYLQKPDGVEVTLGFDRPPSLTGATPSPALLPAIDIPALPVEKPPSLIAQAVTSPTALSPVVASGTDRSRSVRIPRVTAAPKLEEFMGGDSRHPGARVSDFRQREPGDNIPASEDTSAYLSYDSENLYVAFVCKDQPGMVRGRMSKREDIGGDDSVSVYLDTFHDGQHSYVFTVNPLGIQLDGMLADGRKEDDRFDTVWRSEGRITPDGYVTLFAIPFKSLRFSNQSAQSWGIALRRSILRNNENSFWPYITRKQNTFVQQMAQADGLEMISQDRNIRLIPYLALTNSKQLDPGVPRYQTQNDFRGGLDSKFVFRSSLTLDATINPDFSQVESDDPQVTVNQRYEVLFPEKRPFFIENINYFETPLDLLFTRRIVDPEFGARLTGKLGRWNIGVLGIDDRAPGKVIDAGNSLYGDHAKIGVVRVQREFGKNSNVGVLATDREFGASANRIVSIDTRLRLSPRWYFSGQVAHSEDRSYDKKFNLIDRSGSALLASLSYSDLHWSYSADHQDLSAGFQAPLGYIKRTDIRKEGQYLGYFFRPKSSKILDFGPSVTVGADWDHGGLLQDWYSNVAFQADFAGPVGFTIARYDAFERYLLQGFRYNTVNGSFYANWMRRLTFYGSFQNGIGVNYSPAAGLDPFKGTTQNVGFGIAWRPAQRMRLEEYYYFSRFGILGGLTGVGSLPATAFVNHLIRTKLTFQFTRALSLRGILDYYGLLPNPTLFNSDKYKTLTADILLTYLLNPGTALYMGFNNGYQNLAIDPQAPPGLRRYGPPDYMTGRQVFVKLSYLLHF